MIAVLLKVNKSTMEDIIKRIDDASIDARDPYLYSDYVKEHSRYGTVIDFGKVNLIADKSDQ